jgi:hypothetical protein
MKAYTLQPQNKWENNYYAHYFLVLQETDEAIIVS